MCAWAAGTYTKGNNATGGWAGDAALSIGIEAGRHDTQDNDFAAGINQCLNKDGSNSCTGNLNLGGNLPVNIGAGTAAAPAICAGNDIDTGIFSPTANEIGIATNGTEQIRLTSTGLVGIGTTSPSVRLQVSRASGTNAILANSGAIADGEAALIRAQVDSPLRRAEIGVGKHSGITNPVGYIQLFEEDGTTISLWSDNSSVLRIGGGAQIGTTGGTVVGTQTSDERLKNVNGPIQYGLDAVNQIQPVAFTYKDRPDVACVGFVAQQIESIVPESVYDTLEHIEGKEDERTKLAMDYSALIPVLVKAVQELSAKVESLEAQLAGQ